MADYFSPTVVQQAIPVTDMTPLERLVLGLIFEATESDGKVYFHSWEGPCTDLQISARTLMDALNDKPDPASTAHRVVLDQSRERYDETDSVEIDLSGTSYEFILQDILRRSPDLNHITVVTSFTCSKMRLDGFGGMAVLITPTVIAGKSTNDIIEDLVDEHCCSDEDEPNETPVNSARSELTEDRMHPVLHVSEKDVARQIPGIIETLGDMDPEAFGVLTANLVTNGDIRSACLEIAKGSNLDHERESATFKAATAAVHAANRRLGVAP